MSRRFTQSLHCRSGRHCGTCRNLVGGRLWRWRLGQRFVLPNDAPDFACPYGKGWGHVPRGAEPVRAGIGTLSWRGMERVGVHRLLARLGYTRCGCRRRAEAIDRVQRRLLGFIRKLGWKR